MQPAGRHRRQCRQRDQRRSRVVDHAACPTALRPIRDRIASAVMTCFSSISPDSHREVGQRARHSLTRCRPPRRQPTALELAVEHVAGGLRQRRELVEPVLVEGGVEHAAAVERHPPGGHDAGQDLGGRLPRLTAEQLLDLRSGDGDAEIEAIEQRARQAPDVALPRALVALARAGAPPPHGQGLVAPINWKRAGMGTRSCSTRPTMTRPSSSGSRNRRAPPSGTRPSRP